MKPGEAARIESVQKSPEPARERRARRLEGEYAARRATDIACRHFAEHGSWPHLDTDATLYVHDRWLWGLWFSRWLDETASLDADHSREEWIEWLFIEAWEEFGSWRWRESQRR